MSSKPRIYLSSPHMGGQEQAYVSDAFTTNWIAPLGPHVDAFEQEFAEAVGAQYAVALSSGTAALHLALRLLELQPEDEVFVSDFTFCASVNPILYERAIPVFIGSETASWNMDPALLEEVLAERAKKGKLPKALILVHLYGQSADIEPIARLCEAYNITLIEDAAEALGATYKGKSPGTFGKAGIFSFNGNKIITTSGGGMLVTDDESYAIHVRKLATQARDSAPHYQHSEIGFNYRLSNVLAGIGRGQLKVLEERVVARRRNFERYKTSLSDIEGITFMPEASWGRHTRWLTCMVVDPKLTGVTREDIRLALEVENIEARPLWKPMHLQPIYAQYPAFHQGVEESLFENGLCLPSGSNLSTADVERVISLTRRMIVTV